MYSPEQNSFVDMIAKSDLVPVHRTIVADLETPLTLFAKVAALDPHAFLFESVITSYSIHYTKLYERAGAGRRHPTGPGDFPAQTS